MDSLFARPGRKLVPLEELPIAVLPTTESNRSFKLALAAARTAHENRGRDIVILDTRQLTAMFDYFVLVTGTSRRQLNAISDEIHRVLKTELNDRRLGIEGHRESRWILLDYGNLVVHLFDESTRDFYHLEDLWSDASTVEFDPEAD